MKKSSDRSTAVEFLKTITELRRELSAANARIKELEIENAVWRHEVTVRVDKITALDAEVVLRDDIISKIGEIISRIAK